MMDGRTGIKADLGLAVFHDSDCSAPLGDSSTSLRCWGVCLSMRLETEPTTEHRQQDQQQDLQPQVAKISVVAHGALLIVPTRIVPTVHGLGHAWLMAPTE